jgi:hypothetical protein
VTQPVEEGAEGAAASLAGAGAGCAAEGALKVGRVGAAGAEELATNWPSAPAPLVSSAGAAEATGSAAGASL